MRFEHGFTLKSIDKRRLSAWHGNLTAPCDCRQRVVLGGPALSGVGGLGGVVVVVSVCALLFCVVFGLQSTSGSMVTCGITITMQSPRAVGAAATGVAAHVDTPCGFLHP